MGDDFHYISLRVARSRFTSWEHFMREAPEYSIGLEVIDDTPGHHGHYVHFDHHAGVIREATMSAAMQAYVAVRQGRLMSRWLQKRCPVPVYVWNADQDVCLAAFILENHELLERAAGMPMLRWIVQYNNKLDVCGGLYPVNLDDLVKNHFTWVFEPYRQQRMHGKTDGDEALVKETIRQVCSRLGDLLEGKAGIAPITAEPEILYESPYGFVIVDEKGDPASRLVLAARGHTNLISLICKRPNGRYTYSVIRGSSYDEDLFQVPKLIEAFQAAEDPRLPRIWGGSNLAAGSDSEFGSSLHWTRLRDIAEPLVREAWATQRLAAVSEGPARRSLLLVMPAEDRIRIEAALAGSGFDLIPAVTCAQARAVLAKNPPVDAVFTAVSLSDATLGTLMECAVKQGSHLPVIVCLKEIDGGWIDLLEAGAFDLLTEPYDPAKVRDVVERIRELGCEAAVAATQAG